MNYNYPQNSQPLGVQFQNQNQNQLSYMPQAQPQTSIQMPPSFFLQSQGSVYSINSSNEVQNIPAAMGLVNVGICLRENMLYLKSIQNGVPVLMSYRLSATDDTPQEETADKKIATILADYDARIKKIEESLTQKNNTKGGATQWQL